MEEAAFFVKVRSRILDGSMPWSMR